ncbi:Eco57I restriction-modification methylase domain-containing protein [Humibacter sp. RRB41]|uniref:Eco57I restriction-modification methylase domain-containing protein n=1 Tax=Humibacter sp. RRB41 TaxID=2919946 RepID=UPI001FAA67D6|nr:Eco57I restriction-modification methylase domain-containing protein [Humibacter sp. RRB41]
MSTQAELLLARHNPDVLTCIANLSNDEVFTPPEFANRMLDTLADAWADANNGANIWADPKVTFLDPFTKSGVFLREIVSRLTEGLEKWMPDLQSRVDHILTKQVFGIGITRLTALLARRSVYCSKDATGPHSVATSFGRDWGNIWFERTEHTWVGGHFTDKLGPDGDPVLVGRRCRFCGATEAEYGRKSGLETHAYAFIHTDDINARISELFGADMQFDVIIGNPPYQLSDEVSSNTTTRIVSAVPIYDEFVQQAKELQPRFLSLIIPSRWMAGGRGLDTFRKTMLSDRHLRVLFDYPDATDVFGQGVRVSGGVCYFLRQEGYLGSTQVTTVRGDHVSGPLTRKLDEYDVFVRDVDSVSILRRVRERKERAVSTMFVSGFGLDTNFADFRDSRDPDDLVLHLNVGGMGHRRAIRYVRSALVNKGRNLIDAWKVLVPSAAGYGAEQLYDRVLGKPIVAGPGEVATATYRMIGPFDSEVQARNFESYYSTRFFRFLVSLRKVTQHAAPAVYSWVPVQSWDRSWRDEDLYRKYGITEDEQAYIGSRIRAVDWTARGADAAAD